VKAIAKLATTGLCLTIFTWTPVWGNGAAEASNRSEGEGHNCVAFYVVPDNHSDRFDVDACWGGPHITLAGFARYPHKASAGNLSYQEALNVVPKKAAKVCSGAQWGVSDRDAQLKGKHQDTRTAVNRYLEFRDADHPSHTLKTLADKLAKLGVQKTQHRSPDLGLHLTFDQCGCYGKCPNNTRNKWKKEGIRWKLIPVSSVECNFPKAIHTCNLIPNPNRGGKDTHGRCTHPNDVTWHTGLGATVKSCSR